MRRRIVRTLAACWALAPLGAPAQGQLCATERVNVSTQGAQTEDDWSFEPTVSDTGRFVAFNSRDDGLVPGDTNQTFDVFLRDRFAGTTTRVSVDSSGAEANGASRRASLSASGRWIAYDSDATNLVPVDVNGARDVFVHDVLTGTVTRASVNASGRGGNQDSDEVSISGDGAVVVFHTSSSNLIQGDANGVNDVYVRDLVAGVTARVSLSSAGLEGNGQSSYADASGDGRWVAFHSNATNLVAGDTNGAIDVFVRDRLAATTERVSLGPGAAEANGPCRAPGISGDGNRVAFCSAATNLVPGDTNGRDDIFVRDRANGTTLRVSVSSTGAEANGPSSGAAISRDGDHVAFYSAASNLVPGDTNGRTDVFVHHIPSGTTSIASVSTQGVQGDADSDGVLDLSQDGGVAVFASKASNLVPGDTNAQMDVFARDCRPPPASYCTAGTSAAGCRALLGASGFASATTASGFLVTATAVEGGRAGLFYFGASGRQANPWGNGSSFQCVVPPVKRAGLLAAAGTAGNCDGSFAQDLNALWCPTCPKPGHNPGAGATVQAQLWYRDPQGTSNQTTSLSDALELQVGP